MKKIISLLLAVLMVVLLLPVMAFATEPDVSTWAKLQTAINGTLGDDTTPATESTTITLTQNLTATNSDSNLIIGKGKKIVLDLNGKTLDRGLASPTTGGYVIWVKSGAELTVMDSIGGGKITGGNNSSDGGGVCVEGTFTMTGGTIIGNKANKAGGVAVEGTFTMTGGTITGNTTTEGGGGVFVYANGTFTMTGGTITGNTAGTYGGGVLAGSNMYVGGTAKVSGNVSTKQDDGIAESNIHLNGSSKDILKVSAENPLTDGASIGVTVWLEKFWEPGTEVGSYLGDTMNDSNYKYFFMTNSNSANQGKVYNVVKNGENYVLSSETYKVTVNESENGNVTAETLYCEENKTVTLTVTPAEGYQLKKLKYTYDDITTDITDAQSFTMPAADVTVTAEFELIPEPEPERRSSTTITVGDRDDKEETKAEETAEENPDTGAPILSMSTGIAALAVIAAVLADKKHK